MKEGKYDNAKPRAHQDQHEAFSEERQAFLDRLVACHVNQLETLGVYAGGVAAAALFGNDNTAIIVLCAIYLAARTAYVAAYVSPQVFGGYLRTLCFVFSLASISLIWGRSAFFA